MEGFLNLRLPVWLRRLVTRALAIVPAVIVVGATGDAGATKLLVLSQVILSLQLPFAVVPLVRFTGSRTIMGDLASPAWLRVLAWGSRASSSRSTSRCFTECSDPAAYVTRDAYGPDPG